MDIKTSLGFGKSGYITIFKNVKKEYNEWFRGLPAKWSNKWGWYLPAGESIDSLPYGVESVRLNWTSISDNGELKNDKAIAAVIDELIYDSDNSKFLGLEGDEVQACVIIKRAVPLEDKFGKKYFYVMDDVHGNHLVWTSRQQLDQDGIYLITGTVKKLQKYRNKNQTVLGKAKVEKMGA